ncbi:MAG: glycine oxidase ThiO [Leptospirillia bacterium]
MANSPRPTPDVLILGGGIIGTLCAIELARKGAVVHVLERSAPGRESSWAGAGILSPIYPWNYPDALSHLVNRSLSLYPALVEWLAEVSGTDPQHRKSGLIIPVFHTSEWAALSGAGSWSRRFGWVMERLDRTAARTVEPCLGEDMAGGLYWPDTGQIRNPRLIRAAEAAARHLGVVFHSGEEVIGIERRDRRVTGARTPGGHYTADKVLIATGSWSGGVAESAGFSLPVSPVKGQILLLKTAPGTLRRIVKHDQAYLVPRADGRILVGATMEMAGFDRHTTVEAMHFLFGAVRAMTPVLSGAEVEKHWMGFRPGTPDGLPFLGRAPGTDNLYVAAGHYRNGVILAPATAEAMACMIDDKTPPVALDAFAVDRQAQAHATLGLPT